LRESLNARGRIRSRILDERRGIEELVREVLGSKVDAELRSAVDRSERVLRVVTKSYASPSGAPQPEADALLLEEVHDRPPTLASPDSPADLVEVVRGNDKHVPDARAGEAVDLFDTSRVAARGRAFIRSAARLRTPSDSPSPTLLGAEIARCAARWIATHWLEVRTIA